MMLLQATNGLAHVELAISPAGVVAISVRRQNPVSERVMCGWLAGTVDDNA